MRPKIVTVLKHAVLKGIIRLLVEVFKNDSQEFSYITMPNFESIPVKNQKTLLIPLDNKGRAVCIGVPLETDITNGETKIKGTTENGELKGQIYIKNDGSIEIGLDALKPVITDLFKIFYDAHVHPLIIDKQISGIPSVAMPDSVFTTKVKLQ